MKSKDDLIPVSQFMAESERNIEIASVMREQYESAREEILKGFFESLAAGLKTKRPAWSSCYTEPFFTKRYGAFDLFKEAWSGRFTVRVEAYDWGKRMIFGVWRDANLLGNVRPNAKLLFAVKGKLPRLRVTSRSYYEAEIVMTSPAKDWRTPNALWRMQSDKTFRAEVEDLMLEIADLAEAHIDLMVKQRRRAGKR